jgi:hypothetical protein
VPILLAKRLFNLGSRPGACFAEYAEVCDDRHPK